jgi:hypothetical protein
MYRYEIEPVHTYCLHFDVKFSPQKLAGKNLSSKLLLWIPIRTGSRFNDFVDLNPDCPKILDPD